MTEVDNWRTLPNALDGIGGHQISVVSHSPEQAEEHVGEKGDFIRI